MGFPMMMGGCLRVAVSLILVSSLASAFGAIAAADEFQNWKREDGEPVRYGSHKLAAVEKGIVTLLELGTFKEEKIPLQDFSAANRRLIELWQKPDRRADVEWAQRRGRLQIDDQNRPVYFASGAKFGDDDLRELIQRFPNVVQLWINPADISDAGWQHLAAFKQLQDLQVEVKPRSFERADKSQPLRAIGIDMIAALPALTSFKLEGDYEQPLSESLEPLNKSRLKAVAIKSIPLTPEQLQQVAAIPHLTELLIDIPPLAPRKPPLLVNLAAAKNLTALELPNSVLTDDDAKRIASFPQLQRVEFDGWTPQGYVELGKLADLESLRVNGYHQPGFTDADLAQFGSSKRLMQLRISRSQITDQGAATLARLTQLEELALPGTLTAAGIKQLGPLRNLKRFYLYTDSEFKDRVRMSNFLQLLVDQQGRSVQEALHLLSPSSNPRTGPLILVSGSPDLAAAKYLTQLPEVQQFLINDPPADDWLKAYRDMKGIQVLSIWATLPFFGEPGAKLKVSRAGFAHIASWNRLHTLLLYRCDLDGDALAHLPHAGQIKTLRIVDSLVPAASLQGLSKFQKLEELVIDSPDLRGADLRCVANLTELKTLRLSGEISLAELRQVKGLKKLHRIETRLNQLQFSDLYQMFTKEFGRTPTQAVEMILSGEYNEQRQLIALNWQTKLYLTAGLVETSPQVVADDLKILQHLPHVQKVTLPVDVRGEGLAHLALAPQLKQLIVNSKHVIDASLVPVTRLQNLEELTLENAPVSEQGLATVLKLPQLKKLTIKNTQLDAAAVEKLKREDPRVTVER